MLRKNYKFFLLLFLLVGLAIVPKAFAQMGMMGSDSATQQNTQELQNQVNVVLKSQNISSLNQLNCKIVTPDQFEKVGDAYMGVMAGNEENHSFMEQRMGGDNSENLKNVHIQMGKNYLGCQTNKGGGFSMMGWGGYGYGNMMNGSWGWGFGLLGLLFWLVAFVDLILLGIFLWKRIKK